MTDYLALCGDKTDGIPGVRGIGDKTAVQLLTEFESLEGILSAAVLGKIKGQEERSCQNSGMKLCCLDS